MAHVCWVHLPCGQPVDTYNYTLKNLLKNWNEVDFWTTTSVQLSLVYKVICIWGMVFNGCNCVVNRKPSDLLQSAGSLILLLLSELAIFTKLLVCCFFSWQRKSHHEGSRGWGLKILLNLKCSGFSRNSSITLVCVGGLTRRKSFVI